ncbi:putative ferric-chelate reductase protein [Lasiodiplodia theobromae]|nr:putative ferric-chelate reductase protein [Lasiodiplodia theobromae]
MSDRHTSKFTSREYNVYLWPLVAVWAFDRLLRLLRLLYCNLRASLDKSVSRAPFATVRYSAATDVIRIHIQSSSLPLKPGPGQYYYLYQPFALKGWENHPFSLGAYSTQQEASSRAQPRIDEASSKEMTTTTAAATGVISSSESSSSLSDAAGADVPNDFVFWVRPHDGWTRRLRDQCLKSTDSESSIEPSLLIEGPYGHSKPLHTFDTVVLIAGGTGIAAAAPYMIDHQARCSSTNPSYRTRTTKIKLVWAVKQAAFLRDVCNNELATALQREDTQCALFATSGAAGARGDGGDGEDGAEEEGAMAAGEGFEIHHGRPDVAAIVAETAREAMEGGARTAVFVCGPAGMVDETRAAVHAEMKKGCRLISYVEECFGW